MDSLAPTAKYGWTLERYISDQQRRHPDASGEFSRLFEQLALAGKIIASRVNMAGLVDVLGVTGDTNVQGEQVQKLDIFANNTLIHILEGGGQICLMGSEEIEDPIPLATKFPRGRYIVMFDPLDGSTNIDINASIGTIFSVLERISPSDQEPNLDDCLQPGFRQVAAGYIIYGSSTMFVYTSGKGVHGFTLDPTVGDFFLSHPDIKMPERGKIYAVNEGNRCQWDDGVVSWVDWIKEEDKETKRPYRQRYIGALVADFHRTLLKGGIFAYPADKTAPEGKLRLLYEASPMAFLAEQAGGAASTGTTDIMQVTPTSLHQRVPLYIGSRGDVADALKHVKK